MVAAVWDMGGRGGRGVDEGSAGAGIWGCSGLPQLRLSPQGPCTPRTESKKAAGTRWEALPLGGEGGRMILGALAQSERWGACSWGLSGDFECLRGAGGGGLLPPCPSFWPPNAPTRRGAFLWAHLVSPAFFVHSSTEGF